MKENTSYKIVALLITLILWVIILGSKESVAVKMVPVEFILPKGMAITNSVPREVAFKAAGPRLVLKKFIENREPMVIDLGAAAEGYTAVRFHADSINFPAGVRILSMSPSTVNPKLEKLVPKTLPIEVSTQGRLPGDKKVVSLNAEPKIMTVWGPQSIVDGLKGLSTVPIDLNQVQNTQSIEVPLILEEIGLERNKNARVKVEITVQ